MLETDEPERVAIVAEDDPSNRMVLCRMLGKLGYDAIRAVDGVQAVKLADQMEAEIVFLDLGMPRLGGVDALAAIRAETAHDGLRIVAVTGDVTDHARQTCSEAGFDAFLPKPVEFAALEAVLARASGATS